MSDELADSAREVQTALDLARRRLQEPLDAQRRFLEEVQSCHEAGQRALQAVVDQQRDIAAQFKSIVEVGQQLAQAFEPISSLVHGFDEVAPALQELPDRTRKALRTFASNGWYLDPQLGMPDLWEVERLFETERADDAHEMLCHYFDRRAEEIERQLCKRFLNRASVLSAAFGAHRRGEYALAIPVFLAQADGIGKELRGVDLYTRRNGVLAARLRIAEELTMLAAYLSPLVEPHPISAGRSERDGLADLLNRHAILHGESFDYDTRRNSCRAMSWLGYVAWILDKRLDGPGPSRESATPNR